MPDRFLIISKLEYEQLLDFRTAIRKFLRVTEEGARAVGLTPQPHQVLLAVKEQVGRDWASISEIANALQLRHHTTVGLVDRCQGSDLVTRTPHPEDRRLVQIRLTEKGESLLSELSAQNLVELRALAGLMQLPKTV